ncbi:MAG: hypothetical protein ACXAE3_15140 [Candidatus Kariarchaeaceae archaeon]|jgi:hypothetical protein
MKFKLAQQEVENVLRGFHMHHISLMQRGILAQIAIHLSEATGIDADTIMACYYRIITSWEEDEGEEFKILEKLEPHERKEIVEKLVDKLKAMLHNLLVDISEKEDLDQAIDNMFAYYQENYMLR